MPKVVYTQAKGLVQSTGAASFSITGNVVSNYMRFVAGDWYGMSLTTLNDAQCDDVKH